MALVPLIARDYRPRHYTPAYSIFLQNKAGRYNVRAVSCVIWSMASRYTELVRERITAPCFAMLTGVEKHRFY